MAGPSPWSGEHEEGIDGEEPSDGTLEPRTSTTFQYLQIRLTEARIAAREGGLVTGGRKGAYDESGSLKHSGGLASR